MSDTQISLFSNDERVVFEAPDADLPTRELAARINNLVVTGTFDRVQITGPRSDAVRAEIRRRFPQVTRFLSNAPGQPVPVPTLEFTGAPGVNIGQTNIKVYAAATASRPEVRLVSGWDRSCARRADHLLERVLELILRCGFIELGKPPALGLALGGMVANGIVQPNSGLTRGLPDAEQDAIIRLPQLLEDRLGTPVAVVQDMQAKGVFHARLGLRKTLIVDVGTSLGGVFIEDKGQIAHGHHQVGRVAVDLSQAAPWRADMEGQGCLTTYFSASIATSVDEEVFSYSIRDSSDLAERFVTSLGTLIQLYKPETTLVSGGLFATPLGLDLYHAAVRELGQKIRLSHEPLFDGAIGVSLIAGARS